jgi:hypothetical protein
MRRGLASRQQQQCGPAASKPAGAQQQRRLLQRARPDPSCLLRPLLQLLGLVMVMVLL